MDNYQKSPAVTRIRYYRTKNEHQIIQLNAYQKSPGVIYALYKVKIIDSIQNKIVIHIKIRIGRFKRVQVINSSLMLKRVLPHPTNLFIYFFLYLLQG